MRSHLILIRRHTHSLLIHALTPPSENINSLSRRAEPTFTRDNFPLDPFASSSPRFPAPTRLTPVTRYAQRYGTIFSLSHTFARDDGFFFYFSSHQRVHRGLTVNNRVRRTFTASRISSSHPRIAHISSLHHHHHHHHHQLGRWSSGSSGAQRRTTTTVASGEQFWRAIFNFSLATQLYTHTQTSARAHTFREPWFASFTSAPSSALPHFLHCVSDPISSGQTLFFSSSFTTVAPVPQPASPTPPSSLSSSYPPPPPPPTPAPPWRHRRTVPFSTEILLFLRYFFFPFFIFTFLLFF